MPLKRIAPAWQKPITKFFISHSPKLTSTSPTLVINACDVKPWSNGNLKETENDRKLSFETSVEADEIDKENQNAPAKTDCVSTSPKKRSSTETLDEEGISSVTGEGIDSKANDEHSGLDEAEESSGEENEQCEGDSTEEDHQLTETDVDRNTAMETNIEKKPTILSEKISTSKTNENSKKKTKKKTNKRPVLRVMIGAKYQRLKKVSSKHDVSDKTDDKVS